MRARTGLGAIAVAAALVVGGGVAAAAADPTYCTGSAASVDGNKFVVQVNGYFADPDGYDVDLRCFVLQHGREAVGLSDPLVGPVAAVAVGGIIDAAPFQICYRLTVSDPVNAWGFYYSWSNCTV
jgi:hypothetical protein